jgi:hypothetical protein
MPKRLAIPPETTTNSDDALFANPRFMVYLLKEINAKMDEQKLTSGQYQERMDARFEEINRTLAEIPQRYATKTELQAVEQERASALEKARQELTGHVERIDKNIAKVGWTVVLAVIGAIMAMVLRTNSLLN